MDDACILSLSPDAASSSKLGVVLHYKLSGDSVAGTKVRLVFPSHTELTSFGADVAAFSPTAVVPGRLRGAVDGAGADARAWGVLLENQYGFPEEWSVVLNDSECCLDLSDLVSLHACPLRQRASMKRYS